MAKLTASLLRRACKDAQRAAASSDLITKAFLERYGLTHSDADAEALIDALDYGQSTVTSVKECDRIMADLGHARLKSKAAE